MERLKRIRAYDDGLDAWEVADAAPAAALAETVSRYTWWRARITSFDTRRELASTSGVFIINLGATLEITDAGRRTICLGEGQAFVGGMAQGTSLSRSTGDREGVHVFLPSTDLPVRLGCRLPISPTAR